jgi:hypothetical protein
MMPRSLHSGSQESGLQQRSVAGHTKLNQDRLHLIDCGPRSIGSVRRRALVTGRRVLAQAVS